MKICIYWISHIIIKFINILFKQILSMGSKMSSIFVPVSTSTSTSTTTTTTTTTSKSTSTSTSTETTASTSFDYEGGMIKDSMTLLAHRTFDYEHGLKKDDMTLLDHRSIDISPIPDTYNNNNNNNDIIYYDNKNMCDKIVVRRGYKGCWVEDINCMSCTQHKPDSICTCTFVADDPKNNNTNIYLPFTSESYNSLWETRIVCLST